MSSHLAIPLLVGLSSLLAGLVIGRGLLRRRREEKARVLAKDLTDRVHDRCDAYRRLESRISGVIEDFEQQQAQPADETIQRAARVEAPRAVAAPAPAAAAAPACAEGLGWMEDCQAACPAMAAPAEPARGAQDYHRELLEAQNRTIENLQSRIAAMESSSYAAPRPEPFRSPIPPMTATSRRAPPSQDPELRELSERLANSERDLGEWRAQCEQVVHERELGIARARELLQQIRSDVAPCHPAGALTCETCERAQELARQILELRPGIVERPNPRPEARMQQFTSPIRSEIPAPMAPVPSTREVTDLERRLAAKQLELETMRGELSRASQVIDGNKTRITHLMRSLEQTQAQAEERRRLVQEQTTQVTEAYSMLDRMRPLLRAIEGAAADEQISALTPEYLEARARG